MSGSAQGLISAWHDRNAAGIALDPAAPEPPATLNGSGLEGTHGDNNSVEVGNVAMAPWKPLVLLAITFPHDTKPNAVSYYVGSGVLIAPNVVLTAAHNVFRLANASYATAIAAQAGVYKGTQQARSRAARVFCPPAYRTCKPKEARRHNHDYALVVLTDNALGKWAGTHFRVQEQDPMEAPDLQRSKLTVAGYPGHLAKLTLMMCFGEVKKASITDATFNYTMDTMPGQSGGPVFRYEEGGGITFAGVHVSDGDGSNRACRYSAAMRNDIATWLKAPTTGQAVS